MHNQRGRIGLDYKFLVRQITPNTPTELPIIDSPRSVSIRNKKIKLKEKFDRLHLLIANKTITDNSKSTQTLKNLLKQSPDEILLQRFHDKKIKQHLTKNKMNSSSEREYSHKNVQYNLNSEYFPQVITNKLQTQQITSVDISIQNLEIDFPILGSPNNIQRESFQIRSLKSIIKQDSLMSRDIFVLKKSFTLREDTKVRNTLKRPSYVFSNPLSPQKGMVDMKFIQPKNPYESARPSTFYEQQPIEPFISLTNKLKGEEVDNEQMCTKKIETYLLGTKQSKKKSMKNFIEESKMNLTKQNLQSKQENLNNIISILQQPLHLNNTVQDQVTIEQELQNYKSKFSSKTKILIKNLEPDVEKEDYIDYRSVQMRRLERPIRLTMKQIRMSLLRTLRKLKRLKITYEDLMQSDVFSVKPFQKLKSYEYMQAAKQNDMEKVKAFLFRNKFLVYDFDYAFLTALHWVAKRGFLQMAQLLILNGADPDFKDLIGRTPLYLAASFQHVEMVQLLLYHQADPWSTITMDYSQVIKNNYQIHNYLTISRRIHILLSMSTPILRDQMWKKEASSLFIDPDLI